MNPLVQSMIAKARQEVESAWTPTTPYQPVVLDDTDRVRAQATAPTQEAKGKTTGMVRLDPVGKGSLAGKTILGINNRRAFTHLESESFVNDLSAYVDAKLSKLGLDQAQLIERYKSEFLDKITKSNAAFGDVHNKRRNLFLDAASIARKKKVLWDEKSDSDKMTWILQHSDSEEMKQRIKEIKRLHSIVVVTISSMEDELRKMVEADGISPTIMAGLFYLFMYNRAVEQYNNSIIGKLDEAEALNNANSVKTGRVFMLVGRSMQALMLEMEQYHHALKNGEEVFVTLQPRLKKKRFFFKQVPVETDVFLSEDDVFADAKTKVDAGFEFVIEKVENGIFRLKDTHMVLETKTDNVLPRNVEEVRLFGVEYKFHNTGISVEFKDYEITAGQNRFTNLPALSRDRQRTQLQLANGITMDTVVGLPLDLVHQEGVSYGAYKGTPICMFKDVLEGQQVAILSVIHSENDRHDVLVMVK